MLAPLSSRLHTPTRSATSLPRLCLQADVLLLQWCAGIDSTSRMVGNAGGKDVWFSLLEIKRSDGCIPRIR